MKQTLFAFALMLSMGIATAQRPEQYVLLQPARVFDGEKMQDGWWVLLKGNLIEAAGPSQSIKVPPHARKIELKGMTLLPGLIEGHSHLFLHPYNETSWNDQVLFESRAERTARAVNHAKATLMAGFTTVRDLGTEGAMYDDVGLKTAINKWIMPGPRMIIATRAIVAKGSYGPRFDSPDIDFPQGAAEVSGNEDMANEVRTQIGKGADFIKIYADYRWGTTEGESLPTFLTETIALAVNIAKSSGRYVAAHAMTPEGMTRAINAGVKTIEHGDHGTAEVFKLMKEKGVALCPTIAAGDAVEQYHGWTQGTLPVPDRIAEKRKSFKLALDAGVTICFGGDVGVFAHGDNAREMEMMVQYGMKPLDVLKSATSVNADVFGYSTQIGRIKPGLFADIIAIEGDVLQNISYIRNIKMVMKDGYIFKL